MNWKKTIRMALLGGESMASLAAEIGVDSRTLRKWHDGKSKKHVPSKKHANAVEKLTEISLANLEAFDALDLVEQAWRLAGSAKALAEEVGYAAITVRRWKTQALRQGPKARGKLEAYVREQMAERFGAKEVVEEDLPPRAQVELEAAGHLADPDAALDGLPDPCPRCSSVLEVVRHFGEAQCWRELADREDGSEDTGTPSQPDTPGQVASSPAAEPAGSPTAPEESKPSSSAFADQLERMRKWVRSDLDRHGVWLFVAVRKAKSLGSLATLLGKVVTDGAVTIDQDLAMRRVCMLMADEATPSGVRDLLGEVGKLVYFRGGRKPKAKKKRKARAKR